MSIYVEYVTHRSFFLFSYYDMGYGEYEEFVALEVPEEIEQYFIALLQS